jgi:hypothetical protein
MFEDLVGDYYVELLRQGAGADVVVRVRRLSVSAESGVSPIVARDLESAHFASWQRGNEALHGLDHHDARPHRISLAEDAALNLPSSLVSQQGAPDPPD